MLPAPLASHCSHSQHVVLRPARQWSEPTRPPPRSAPSMAAAWPALPAATARPLCCSASAASRWTAATCRSLRLALGAGSEVSERQQQVGVVDQQRTVNVGTVLRPRTNGRRSEPNVQHEAERSGGGSGGDSTRNGGGGGRLESNEQRLHTVGMWVDMRGEGGSRGGRHGAGRGGAAVGVSGGQTGETRVVVVLLCRDVCELASCYQAVEQWRRERRGQRVHAPVAAASLLGAARADSQVGVTCRGEQSA